ncbi:MAG: hypothetical protein K2X87_09790 [Gemmataceae bacterium]|nr:hypothetical protein [Gemmataceae bacterium]
MDATITVTVAEPVLARLKKLAAERKLTPEQVAAGDLEQAWLRAFVDARKKPAPQLPDLGPAEDDPLLKLAGMHPPPDAPDDAGENSRPHEGRPDVR